MTREAHAVIGANWGDEGKGLAVDALAAALSGTAADVVVVRANGGAQAGHGVERPADEGGGGGGGGRHVFHHVGAGTFAGAATHLARFFVAHPMVLGAELDRLDALGARPRAVTIDPRAPVTTPWDMAVNQALELARDGRGGGRDGGGRHGSTGLGFGETIERHGSGPRLVAADLWRAGLRARLEAVRDGWLPRRLAALGLDPEASPLADVLTGRTDLAGRFMEDCARFRARVALRDDADLRAAGAVVFEGAQGLQLDMTHGAFPHVTRSHTGLRNVLAVAAEAGLEAIHALYMTRAYATRHGAGPLPHEAGGRLGWAEVVDPTNAPNPWQGAIRLAPLDLDLLAGAVNSDLRLAAAVAVRPALGVTCLDQLRGPAACVQGGRARRVAPGALPGRLAEAVGLPLGLTSHGPTRRAAAFRAGWPGADDGAPQYAPLGSVRRNGVTSST